MGNRSRGRPGLGGALGGVVGALVGTVALAAQAWGVEPIRPWVPAGTDSMVAWAAEARVRFHSNTGDSVSGDNYRAYDLVGRIGRRLLRSLGKAGMTQAPAIQPVLDSLQLDTQLALDPLLPHFALLMVHNPDRITAGSVAFLYWYRGDDLRMQGALFRGGKDPQARVWWTGHPEVPYEWGVISHDRGDAPLSHLHLFRLSSDGYYWNLTQHEDRGPYLGPRGQAAWVDVNRDGIPDLLAFTPATRDSLFDEEGAGAPRLQTEQLFVDRAEGFVIQDARLLPSPYASFALFVRLLLERNRTAAARLLADPSKLDEAVALGWGTRRAPGTWKLEYGEPNTGWPQWLALRFRGEKAEQLYIVHFTMRDGRWIIHDWIPVKKAEPSRSQTAPPTDGKEAK